MRTQNTAPKHRRPRGSGSCKQRAEDGLWVAREYVGVGSERRRLVAYGKEAAAARIRLDEKVAAFKAGRPIVSNNLTVAVQLEEWFSSLPTETRPSSLKLYRYLKGIVAKELGSIPVKTLTGLQIEAMDRRLATTPRPKHPKGLKPQTRAKARTVLSQALKRAETQWKIPNAVRDAQAIPATEPDIIVRSEPEIAAILASLDGWVKRLAIISVSTGARVSELLSIRVRDIDDLTVDRPVWTIRYQLARVDGKSQFAPVKSRSGRRQLVLEPDAVDAINEELAAQKVAKAAAGSKWAAPIPANPEHPEIGDGSDLIFTVSEPGSAPVGSPRNSNSLVHLFQRALAKEGLPPQTWHSLRSVFTNRLGEQEVPVEVVSRILGHSSVAVTLKSYAKVSAERQAAAMALLPRLDLTKRLTAPTEIIDITAVEVAG